MINGGQFTQCHDGGLFFRLPVFIACKGLLMSDNVAAIGKEYVLQDHETIVSKTDIKGRITYVSDDFVRISGFSAEELIGAPHNIVRHPDMPPAAFADLWATVKSGRAWSGLVKNRCKNGDYYWVEATAAPLMHNGQIVGFTSIRVKPDREQVRAAESAYLAIKTGDKSVRISDGAVVPVPLFKGAAYFSGLSVCLAEFVCDRDAGLAECDYRSESGAGFYRYGLCDRWFKFVGRRGDLAGIAASATASGAAFADAG
jgi:PAS domain S-box-containing protein